jgi:hypothetical protein
MAGRSSCFVITGGGVVATVAWRGMRPRPSVPPPELLAAAAATGARTTSEELRVAPLLPRRDGSTYGRGPRLLHAVVEEQGWGGPAPPLLMCSAARLGEATLPWDDHAPEEVQIPSGGSAMRASSPAWDLGARAATGSSSGHVRTGDNSSSSGHRGLDGSGP